MTTTRSWALPTRLLAVPASLLLGLVLAVATATVQAPVAEARSNVAAFTTAPACGSGWTTYTVPTGTLSAVVTLTGGGGGGGGADAASSGSGPGGGGTTVTTTLTGLSAGQVVSLTVGCGGGGGQQAGVSGLGGPSAFGSGGNGGGGNSHSGAGGGATALCLGNGTCTTPLVVAGGGGGGGAIWRCCAGQNPTGGTGGPSAVTNANGVTATGGGSSNSNGGGGGGATQSAAGGAGGGGCSGANGSGRNGGAGAGSDGCVGGGGGGGGYFGGGGGGGGDAPWYSLFSEAGGGGGGGSSYAQSGSPSYTSSLDRSQACGRIRESCSVRTNPGRGGAAAPTNAHGFAGEAGTASITWVVNDAPVGANATYSVQKTTAAAITLAASDPDGDNPVSCSIVTSPGKGSLGGSGCSRTYTANGNQAVGTDTFTYRVTDSLGRTSPNYTITLNIGNRNPSAPARSVSATKGVGLPISLSGTDPDADTISTCTAAQPVEGTLTGTGCSVTYTAPPVVYGTDTFTYTVSDGFGGTSTSATVTVTIDNRVPTAVAQTFTVGPESETELVLGGSDLDDDATTCVTSGPTGGSLDELGDCTYLYVAPVTPGTYTFSYTRSDGAPATSAPATVTIVVTEPVIGGTVVADDTGEGIPGITVRLYEDGVGFTSHVTVTDAEGAFDLGSQVPAGEYRVIFRDPTQSFVDEWYDDSLTRSGSTPVEFNGVNDLVLEASLATGAQIDVSISNPGSYTVALYNTAPTGASAYRSVPGVTGSTSLRGLPAGTYYVSVTDPSGALVQRWSGNQAVRDDAVGIDLDAGDSTSSSFTLLAPNTISGTVLDVEGPVPLVTVQAYGATSGLFVKSTKTDAEGEYLLKGLPVGGYKLVFRDSSGAHPVTWFGGGEVIGSAATVTMTTGGALTVDGELPVPGSLSGTVTGGSGGTTPLAGAKVTLYRNGAAVRTLTTDGTGGYSATGLAPGGYTVLFTATGHRSEYNLDRFRKADADVVDLGDGDAVDLDATLGPA